MIVYLVCIAKNENRYIREWIDWMLGKGFDKIIICENNDKEKISDVVDLNYYDKLSIVDYSGVSCVQPKAYTEAFLNFRRDCDWMFFCDCDEFLMLDEKYENVKDFLSEECFNDADIIRVNWKLFSGKTENSNYDAVDGNYSVVERFKDEIKHNEQMYSKSFIKTDITFIPNTKIVGHGYVDNHNLLAVNELGQKCLNKWSKNTDNIESVSYERCWLNHYPTKTIGEFVHQKMFRGGANRNPQRYNNNFGYWLKYNKRDEAELEYGRKLAEKLHS